MPLAVVEGDTTIKIKVLVD